MAAIENLITKNMDVWTSAIKQRATQGRGSSKKQELYGIQKLRELILELAVRGLLVPQDPNDEPASVLLEKIASKKKNNGKDLKPLSRLASEEMEALLPNSWCWAKFSDVLDFSGGSQPPKSNFRDERLEGYVQLIQIRDLGPRPQPVFVPKDTVSKFCTANDVMIGRYGASVGKVFWGKNGAYNVALIRLHNDFDAYEQGFLYILMLSPLGQAFFTGISRSAQAGFSKKDIEGKLVPILSLAEQKRIVAKVDELMALCDQLEEQQENSLAAHQQLVEVLLTALTQAADTEAFQQAWTRLAANFETLFTTENSIDQLKQTLLQLAVMGKLVPQDPNDEPASVLVKRIFEVKKKLEETENLKTKANKMIEFNEYFIKQPKGWAYIRLGNIAKFIDYRGKTPTKTESGIPLITAKNIKYGFISREPAEFISMEDYKVWMTRGFPRVNDVLFTTEAPLGNVALLDITENFALAQRAICFQLHEPKIAQYLVYLIMSKQFQVQLSDGATGMTAKGIKASKLKEIPVPLPPIEEQKRIVAKVDQLFAICDQLKDKIRTAQTTQLQLADALTSQAVQ